MTRRQLEQRYRIYFAEWRRHADGLLGREDAEDLVQEAILRVIETKKYKSVRELRTFVHGMLKFEALDYRRAHATRLARNEAWEKERDHEYNPYPSHECVLDVRKALDHNEAFHRLFRLFGKEEGLRQLAARQQLRQHSVLWIPGAVQKLRAALTGYSRS